MAGEAYISLYVDNAELASLGRLRTLDWLSIERKQPDYEGMELWLRGVEEPITLQTKPMIRLAWHVKALGVW
ncbi:hypothetical protein ABZ297_15935 [Nonomuraea sp. NPDC005983]|uniref:hypothetical protein n=1 Tax=Nonomuraea sp. NPDC005983 TaxID=3155595 RepID=UPI0033AB26EF